MVSEIINFSLLKDERSSNDGGAYYFLLFDGNRTGVRTYCETIFIQHSLGESGRFFVVLENECFDAVNYIVYLLDANLHVLDCLCLDWSELDRGFIQSYQLNDGVFCFERSLNNKKYALKISDDGEFRYSGRDFKYRALLDFIRPRKFLTLSVQA
ncbi:hypothetical protein NK214_01205 [Chromobacterium sp. S0633]|uniref:hypothetical protein n=1 Tax=Chromobacterium sp. S0633 TaxID=2957805 RepID=UPI0020A05600|nr:hypothetical protein [Chromobacterium sp. S0633]MCP1288798.1 hypothetical protein [Chromobacterium sp. S0633]